MAITVVGSSTGTVGGGGTSYNITLPTMQQGDVCYIVCGQGNSTAPTISTSGFGSAIASGSNGTFRGALFRKVMGATPDTSATITKSNGYAGAAACYVVRGADQGTPEDATVVVTNGSSTNPDPGSITSNTDNAHIIAMATSAVSDANVTAPSGYTNAVEDGASGTSGSASAGAAGKAQTTHGAENPPSWTNWASGSWVAFTIAVKPASNAGTMAATEATDTFAASGNVIVTGTMAVTEDQDTTSISGSVIVAGTMSVTESVDTAAFSGNVIVTGTLDVTETQDAASLAGIVGSPVTGTLDAAESADTFSGAGTAARTGTLDATEAQDAFAASGSASRAGTMAATEAQDVFAADGLLIVAGTLAATEAQDTFAAAGLLPVAGTLDATEATDDAAMAGSVIVAGALAATESPDAIDSSGLVLQVVGTLDATEAQDAFDATGLRVGAGGSLAAQEASDILDAVGTRQGVRTGVLEALEAPDAVVFDGLAFPHSVGMPGADVGADAQRLRVSVGPDFDLDAEAQKLDLAAGAVEAVGDASGTPEIVLDTSWFYATINRIYSSVEPLYPMFRDTVTMSDAIRVDLSLALFDSVQALETLDVVRFRAVDNAVTVADSAALAVVFNRVFSDNVQIADSQNFVDLFGSFFSDTVVATDLMARAVALQKGDVVGIADAASPGVGPGPQDSAATSDVFARVMTYRRTFGDVAAMSDAMVRSTGKGIADTVPLSDLKSGGWGKTLADSFFTADARTKLIGKSLADNPTMSDSASVSVGFRRTLTDAAVMSDIFSSLLNDRLGLSDSVFMSDARAKDFYKARTDTISLTDARVRSFSKPVADTASLASSGSITGQGYANNYFAEDYVATTLATFT